MGEPEEPETMILGRYMPLSEATDCEPTNRLRWRNGILEQEWRITTHHMDFRRNTATRFEWRPVETFADDPPS